MSKEGAAPVTGVEDASQTLGEELEGMTFTVDPNDPALTIRRHDDGTGTAAEAEGDEEEAGKKGDEDAEEETDDEDGDGGGKADDAEGGEGDDGGEAAPPKGEDPAKFWEQKFKASSKGVEGLRTDLKSAKDRESGLQTKISDLEKEIADLNKVAEGKNPEGYDAIKIRREHEKVSKELASLKEDRGLDDFIKGTPDAERFRDKLKAFGRVYPDKSLKDIWKDNFADLAGPAKKAAKEKAERKQGSASDKGKGTSTGKLKGGADLEGHTLEEFGNLSLKEQKRILMKQGGT